MLGSGASVSYGLPSMASLADYIKDAPAVKTDPAYAHFCSELDKVG